MKASNVWFNILLFITRRLQSKDKKFDFWSRRRVSQTHIYTRTRTHTHAHPHARTHAHAHARAHTHTHTHTRTHSLPRSDGSAGNRREEFVFITSGSNISSPTKDVIRRGRSCSKMFETRVTDFGIGRCLERWMVEWMDEQMDGCMGGWMNGWKEGRIGGRMDGMMDGRTDGRMDGRMDGRKDRWMDGRMDGWTDVWIDEWVDEWKGVEKDEPRWLWANDFSWKNLVRRWCVGGVYGCRD